MSGWERGAMARVKDTILPWERQTGETEKAYEAFLIYKNLGPGRTLVAVSERLQKSYTLIRRWAKEQDWKNRVFSWDRDIERKAKAEAEKEQKQMIARHIKIGIQVQGKALEGLKHLKPEKMGAISVQALLDFGTKLERDSRAVTQQEATAPQDAASILASVLERAWSEEGAEEDGEH